MFRALAAQVVETNRPIPDWHRGIEDARLRRVLDYIHNNLSQDLSLSEMAGVAAMSAAHFSKAFKAAIGTHKDHRATAQGVQHVLRDFPGIKVLKYQVHGIKTPQTQKLNNQKLALIQKFQSQYHDVWHKNFLERFAQIKEIFY